MSVSDLFSTICPTLNWKCGDLSSTAKVLLMMKSPKRQFHQLKEEILGLEDEILLF
jgi:hypothetical protein